MLAALGLLHYLGFRSVYLVGADFRMATDRKYAFEENRSAQAIRHNNVLYDSLDRRFHALLPEFRKARFEVLNCCPDSGLTAFSKIDFAEAVERASAECSKPVPTDGWYEPSKEKKPCP